MEVNGLPLPRDLIALMESGRWKPPADRTALTRLIPENAGLHPYSIGMMEGETKGFFEPRMQTPMWQGAPDPDSPPGDIDLTLMVLVADIGLGYDQPIALDYRVSRERPRVITLHWSDRAVRNRWIILAPDILTFAEMVGL